MHPLIMCPALAAMSLDFDKWIAKVKAGEFLAEDELKALCDFVKEVRRASPGFSCTLPVA